MLTKQEQRKLAKEHWEWLEALLRLCGLPDAEMKRLEYIYKTVWAHAIKHGKEVNDEV